MEEHKVNPLVEVDEAHRPLGALNMGDRLRAGVL